MIRLTAACSSGLLVLLLAGPATAEDRPRIALPASPAPVVDGKLDDAAWKDAHPFEIKRGQDSLGEGWLLRSDRQLYVGFRTRLLPLTLGVRLHFTDPATRRRVAVLVMPFDMPRPPLGLSLERTEGAEPLESAACDARFSSEEGRQFSFELRLPLDALQIGKPAKEFRFDVEVWDMGARRPIGYYPLVAGEGGAAKGFAVLEGTPDWGVDAASTEAPPEQAALALLQRLARRSSERGGADEVESLLGLRDGRRNGEALAKLDAELRDLIARFPDYASLRAQRVRVLAGLNRPGDALGVLEQLRKDYPFLNLDQRHALAEAQLMRDAGRYADAIARLEESRELLENTRDLPRDLRMLEALREAHGAEMEYRKADAQRDDLPRVLLETSRGNITIELFEDDAPNAVANFITLVESGYYDGTRFHWVQSGGAAYGGDPNSRDQDTFNDGYGSPGYLIETEPSRRVNLPMTIAFADLRSRPRTQGGTFAFNLTAAPSSDSLVSVFGRVIEGADVVKSIEYYDTLKRAKVIRKRDHEYKPTKTAG
jgi:cyclophilin family peptidyl-prolyl cis-trans isomerase